MKYYIGIDPGITGAIAVVGDQDQSCLFTHDMPTVPDGKKKQRVNAAGIVHLIDIYVQYQPDVYIEDVHAMPGQGVSAMFNFGRSCGILEGVMSAMGLRVHFVTPQAWKREFKLIGLPKDASRTVAQRLYPSLDFSTKKSIGIADALLIAHYGMIHA